VKTPREDFFAVALKDGSILIGGGITNSDSELPVNTGEIFKQSFKAIKQPMTIGRAGPAAAVMTGGAKVGQVLIAAGTDTSESSPQLASAELYDPTKGTFTATKGNLVAARSFAIATALPDGTVLITGGIDNSLKALASAEIYNPTLDMFSQTIGNMNAARVDHSATLLPDGTVLVAGGENSSGKLNSAEIYNPTTQMFTSTVTMNDFRDDNTATLISGSGTALDGQVLIEGGFFNSHGESTAEIYNPTAKTFTATSPMNFAHGEASAALIP
jgi:hypothetical protein